MHCSSPLQLLCSLPLPLLCSLQLPLLCSSPLQPHCSLQLSWSISHLRQLCHMRHVVEVFKALCQDRVPPLVVDMFFLFRLVGYARWIRIPLGFHVKLGLVRGKYLPAGLHAAEASYVSSSAISGFRAAILRAVWSSKMPLANAPAILNLLDGPVGVDPAFHIISFRFRMICRYLSYCPEEKPRIFRMLDLISRGAQGHGLVHLLLISAGELGFAWDGDEKGWVRVSLPPLGMITGPIQHFYSSILDAWRFSLFAKLSERKGFRGVEFAAFSWLFTTTCLVPPAGTR